MKHTINKIRHSITLGLVMLPLALMPITAQARPGTLSNIPLFLSTGVDPNIVFLTDDSGSMDWEVMTTDADSGGIFTGTQPDGSSPAGSGSVKHRDSDNDGDADCSFGSGTFEGYLYIVEFGTNTYTDNSNDCNTADDQEWRIRNSDFNPLYFNPAKTYKPWSGVNKAGVPFTDIDITNAPDDPFDPQEYINLTQHDSSWRGATSSRGTSDRDGDGSPDGFRYYTWTDNDGDGLFDNGEETEHLIKNADATTKQNFANWFSYHRSREFVAKYAISKSVDNLVGTRVGYGTINNNDSVKKTVAAMNLDPASGNKKLLFDQVYDTRSSGGTPLRQNLRNVGRYYDCAADNFFGVSGASCPILTAASGGTCQQNFTILMTDGFDNGGSPSVGNTDTDGAGIFDGGSYADSYSETLADVAMKYYETDLEPSMSNLVPKIPGVDEADHQHMVTYTVAFGVTGTLDPFDTKTPGNAADTDPANASFDWPDRDVGDAEKIDDLWHTAYNGRGEFLSAQDPDQLSTALGDAISSISDRTSSAAAVAFNSTSLGTDSVVYFARFLSGTWSGELYAHNLDAFTGAISGTANWNAATKLNSQAPGSRQIVTYSDETGVGVAFRTLGDLSPKQENDLNMGPSGADGEGQDRIDYLRGDRSDEGTNNNYRVRSNVLGDIIHSNPVYVGKPQMNYPDNFPDPGYAGFKSTTRDGIIYVGANDGMLHGFHEDDGREVFAYVPNALFSNSTGAGLHFLTDPSYSHRYYVDMSPVAADVYLGGAWKTVLIGGLRGGGKGLFALNVTDPTALTDTNAANIVIGEYTASTLSTDPFYSMGYTYSRPTVARLNNGKYAIITGNGYNNSGDGRAYLYVIYLDGTTPVPIPAGSSGSLADPNGLSAPAVIDNDDDGIADYAYAGDLYGDLYRFDLTTFAVTPVFDGTQPITSKPSAARHPTETGNSTKPNILVFFGTGQYLVDADKTTTTTQAFYGIWDGGKNSAIVPADLLTQTFTTLGDYRVVTDNEITYGTQSNKHKGWKIEFTGGERIIADSIVRGDYVVFTTMIPDTTVCSYGGSGWIMGVKIPNGGMPDRPLWDINNDGVFNDTDLVDNSGTDQPPSGIKIEKGMPNQAKALSDLIYVTDTSGDLPDNPFRGDFYDGPGEGRLSWREIR